MSGNNNNNNNNNYINKILAYKKVYTQNDAAMDFVGYVSLTTKCKTVKHLH
jgi:hypothetical protein